MWYIEVVEGTNHWTVIAGEKAIFSADTREAVDAFIYGMALAYSVFPQEYIDHYVKDYLRL